MNETLHVVWSLLGVLQIVWKENKVKRLKVLYHVTSWCVCIPADADHRPRSCSGGVSSGGGALIVWGQIKIYWGPCQHCGNDSGSYTALRHYTDHDSGKLPPPVNPQKSFTFTTWILFFHPPTPSNLLCKCHSESCLAHVNSFLQHMTWTQREKNTIAENLP